MKPAGAVLYGIGTVILIGVLVWMAGGVYTDQWLPFIALAATGTGAAALGAKLNKDPNAHKAVEWRPAVVQPLSAEAPPLRQDVNSTPSEPVAVDTGEMMSCPACGDATMIGAGFCGSCGASLAVAQTPPLPPPPPPAPPATVPEPAVPNLMLPVPAPVVPDIVVPAPVVLDTVAPIPAALPTSVPAPPEVVPPASPGIITPPPGMITPPPGLMAPPTEPVQPTPVPEPVFLTSPGVSPQSPSTPVPPVLSAPVMPPVPPASPAPQAQSVLNVAEDVPFEDLDATVVAVRRPNVSPWQLVLPDESKVGVSGAVLIGRNPAPHSKWPNAQLVSVVDKTKSVSKTHAAIESDEQGLWVVDLKSTNGVVVTGPDGVEVEAEGDLRLKVEAGSEMEFGSFTIRVEKA